MESFTEVQPSLENYWRSIILFGRNVASYKFALGKSLLELGEKGRELITLEDLADPFSRNICEHLKGADKQATSSSSRFLDACRNFNAGTIAEDELFDKTTKLGFTNVIDAFHVVNNGEVGVRFFTDERRGREKGIRLTQDFFKLCSQFQFKNLPTEVEARWRLVETAWELKLPRHMLTVDYDVESEDLLVPDRTHGRKVITGCRDALNGYQKGKCFYCFSDITIEKNSSDLADVDHFFPHLLKSHGGMNAIDGVWNLVLACQNCNRGSGGKFARIPKLRFLERLHRRNDFFIRSHHPLRETLVNQTGRNESDRRKFLQMTYKSAKELTIHNWQPDMENEAAF